MIGRMITGRYKIINNIGQGAFGTTYLAIDTQIPPPNQCIVKHFTPSSTDPEELKKAKELFAREATILHQLGTHPQIPRLLAYPQENQDFFIVQEYIEGDDLKQELPPNVPLNEDFVIQLLKDILEVLEFIHQQEVIHRDLNPKNIRRRTTDNKIVIIDFGAVKQISTQLLGNQKPQNPTIIGTSGYKPREQDIGQPKFSSDIYAVGMIGIQALTGKHPISLTIDHQGKVIWRNLVKVSDQFADFLDKMAEYHHANRYTNATEALTALKEISQPQPHNNQTPVQPQPNNNQQSAKKNKKISPLFVKISSIGLAILVTGMIIFVFLNRRLPECGGKLATYQNREYHINLEYPECWNKDETPDGIDKKLVTFIQPQKNARLMIRSFEYRGTLDQFQDSREQEINNTLEAGNITKTDTIYFSDKEGIKIIATSKNGDEKIKNMYVMTLKGNNAYVIIYSAKENEYDKFLKTVETIIQSIKIQ